MFNFAILNARREIRKIVRERGYVRQRTELEPIIGTLQSEFPKVQRVDILGRLELGARKIKRERYNIHLHEYEEVRRKNEEPLTLPVQLSEGDKRLREILRKMRESQIIGKYDFTA